MKLLWNSQTNPNEINIAETTGTFVVGEQLIYNEKTTDTKSTVAKVNAYNVFDIKSVFQDISTISGSGLVSDFIADSVLYDRVLSGFSPADQLSVTGGGSGTNTAIVAGRNFAGKVGLTTDSIISYNSNDFADLLSALWDLRSFLATVLILIFIIIVAEIKIL